MRSRTSDGQIGPDVGTCRHRHMQTCVWTRHSRRTFAFPQYCHLLPATKPQNPAERNTLGSYQDKVAAREVVVWKVPVPGFSPVMMCAGAVLAPSLLLRCASQPGCPETLISGGSVSARRLLLQQECAQGVFSRRLCISAYPFKITYSQ